VNKSAFGKLEAATQKAVLEAAKAAEPRGWKTSEAENEGYAKTMGEHGIKIMKPSPALSSEFERIGRQMADEWAKKAGAEGEAILKAYRGK
jgi:TRAP-type transport system periplasmic protein